MGSGSKRHKKRGVSVSLLTRGAELVAFRRILWRKNLKDPKPPEEKFPVKCAQETGQFFFSLPGGDLGRTWLP